MMLPAGGKFSSPPLLGTDETLVLVESTAQEKPAGIDKGECF